MPPRKDIFPVYAILVFLIFSWALYRFFWYLPSWLEYLSIPSILIILSYSLAFALLESLVMMGFFVLLALALPKAMFRRQFVAQGSLLALALGAGAYLIQRQVSMIYRWEPWQVGAVAAGILAGILILLGVSAVLFQRLPRLVPIAESFAERMTVFAIVYLPLSVIAWVVVIIRNVMGALA
jgi:hypothetical protein